MILDPAPDTGMLPQGARPHREWTGAPLSPPSLLTSLVLPPPPLLLGRAPSLGRRARPPLRQVGPDARAQLRVGLHLSHGQLGAAEGVGGLQQGRPCGSEGGGEESRVSLTLKGSLPHLFTARRIHTPPDVSMVQVYHLDGQMPLNGGSVHGDGRVGQYHRVCHQYRLEERARGATGGELGVRRG